jgi:hypothetical protein
MQLRNTSGQLGYTTQNQTDTETTITNVATLTIDSTLTRGQTAATIYASVVQAINQFSANQTALMNQMAAMSFKNAPTPPPNQPTAPPIQQLTIPAQVPYTGATTSRFNEGRGGRGIEGQGRGGIRGGGRYQCTPFANHMRDEGGGA